MFKVRLVSLLSIVLMMAVPTAHAAGSNFYSQLSVDKSTEGDLRVQILIMEASGFCVPTCSVSEFDPYLMYGPDGLVGVNFNAQKGPRTFYPDSGVIIAQKDIGKVQPSGRSVSFGGETAFLWPLRSRTDLPELPLDGFCPQDSTDASTYMGGDVVYWNSYGGLTTYVGPLVTLRGLPAGGISLMDGLNQPFAQIPDGSEFYARRLYLTC